MFFIIGNVYLKELNAKLVGKVIVVDIGHGGKDSGTIYGNIREKDINLSIGLKLKEELVKEGVEVILIRDGDYDLSYPDANRRKKSDFDNRIKIINSSNANMYISLHINYLDNSKYYGAQVFYTDENDKIANSIQERFIKNLNSPMKSRKLSNDVYMYKRLKIPGVLVECGFISNSKERELLLSEDYQNKIVSSIVQGIIEYY